MALGLGGLLGLDFDTLVRPEPTRIASPPIRTPEPLPLLQSALPPIPSTFAVSRITTSFRSPATSRVGASTSDIAIPVFPSSAPPSAASTTLVTSSRGLGAATVTTSIPVSTLANESIPPAVNTRAGATAQGFLDNKPLSGFVFVLSGLFVLAVITMIVTCAVRSRQRKKMMDEAMFFDAASMIHDPYNHNGTKEEGRTGLSHSSTPTSARKRASDESFGYGVGHGVYGGVMADGGADTYGLPTLSYVPPRAAFSPQYPQAAHSEPRHKAYDKREYGQETVW